MTAPPLTREQAIIEPIPEEREAAWYSVHGRFRERLAVNASGMTYVIGDYCWNLKRPASQQEYIETRMIQEGIYG